MPDAPDTALLDEDMPAATVEPETSVEVQVELAAEPAVEPAAEPVAPSADVEKLAAVEAELESVRAAYIACEAEKSILVGHLSDAQNKLAVAEGALAPLQAELTAMSEKLAGYELGAALASERLPASAGALVTTLYKNAMLGARVRLPIGAWLSGFLASPEGSPLTMLRGTPPVDPTSSGQPVGSGQSNLPSFLRSPR